MNKKITKGSVVEYGDNMRQINSTLCCRAIVGVFLFVIAYELVILYNILPHPVDLKVTSTAHIEESLRAIKGWECFSYGLVIACLVIYLYVQYCNKYSRLGFSGHACFGIAIGLLMSMANIFHIMISYPQMLNVFRDRGEWLGVIEGMCISAMLAVLYSNPFEPGTPPEP